MNYNLRQPPSQKPRPIWNWHILVHVCRRWRQLIFDSPRRLTLRILCTYGTPVRKSLGIWPAFPIDLQLNSMGRLNPKDEDNTTAALEHPDRVNSVSLCTHGSQLGKMVAVMQKSFPVLRRLYMSSWIEDTPVLTATFLGGSAPHLQAITLVRIPSPALPTLLLSTSNLITLNLLDIPTPGYISPERVVVCLAALPRLKVFGLSFEDATSRPRRIRPPPVTRPVLPALAKLSFQGAFEYLEDLVVGIDSPQLKRVTIISLDQPDNFQVTHVSDFIDRSIGPSPSRHANVHFQFGDITFTLSRDYDTYQGWARRSIATSIVFD